MISNGFPHTERRTAGSVSLLCINKRAPSAFVCTVCGGLPGLEPVLSYFRRDAAQDSSQGRRTTLSTVALRQSDFLCAVSIISGVTCSVGRAAALTAASSLHKPGSNWLHVREPLRDLWPSLQLEHGELEQKQRIPTGIFTLRALA